jgi:hypothetical protein
MIDYEVTDEARVRVVLIALKDGRSHVQSGTAVGMEVGLRQLAGATRELEELLSIIKNRKLAG